MNADLIRTPGILALLAAMEVTSQPALKEGSCWMMKVGRSDDSREPVHTVWEHNTFCSTGNGYNWLAQQMGQGPSFATANCQGQNTSATATTLVNTGATWSVNAFVGCIVVCDTVGAGGAHVYGVIMSNTATTLNVDQWTSLTSSTGAAGTTPNGSSNWYSILPVSAAAAWMALTQTAITPAATDTSLSGELTTLGMSRAVGTFAHVAAASTYTLIHLWTASGSCTINGESQFNSNYPSTGTSYMPFENTEPTPPSLLTGDTLTNTVTVTI